MNPEFNAATTDAEIEEWKKSQESATGNTGSKDTNVLNPPNSFVKPTIQNGETS